jgi:integrase
LFLDAPSLDAFAEALWPVLAVTKKTLENYSGTYQRNIAPHLGKTSLGQVSKADLIHVLSPLPPQTQYQTLMCVRSIFREALYRELIEESPVAKIKAPRITVKPQKFLTWEELNSIDFGYQNARIRFLALHGLRWGEAVALLPEDIVDGKVRITKSVHGATKSKAGVREVPHLSEYVRFPRYQKSVAKALKPYGVTVHSLRKTYAYTLKSSQVHVTTASKLMGHSNPLITLKIYTAVLDDETDKAGEAMSSFLARTLAQTPTHAV